MEVTPPKLPAISVVMPTFKRPDMIRRAVKSVLNQDGHALGADCFRR
ncbi:MAG: hypothetical protein R3C45_02820 [Phycisphaerales bacterium]